MQAGDPSSKKSKTQSSTSRGSNLPRAPAQKLFKSPLKPQKSKSPKKGQSQKSPAKSGYPSVKAFFTQSSAQPDPWCFHCQVEKFLSPNSKFNKQPKYSVGVTASVHYNFNLD